MKFVVFGKESIYDAYQKYKIKNNEKLIKKSRKRAIKDKTEAAKDAS